MSTTEWSKLTWQTQLRGADLTHAEYRVLSILSTYADKDGVAFPSNPVLARGACVDRKTLRTALESLERKGWLRLVQRGSNCAPRRATRWQLTAPAAPEPGNGSPVLIPEVGNHSPVPTAGLGNDSPQSGESDPASGEWLGPYQEIDQAKYQVDQPPEPATEPAPAEQPRQPQADDFGVFWAVYPKRVNRNAAAEAFAAACLHIDAQVIIDGARRYAAADLPDAKYIPFPATWLKDGRWDDESPPPQRADPALSGPPPAREVVAQFGRREDRASQETRRRLRTGWRDGSSATPPDSALSGPLPRESTNSGTGAPSVPRRGCMGHLRVLACAGS